MKIVFSLAVIIIVVLSGIAAYYVIALYRQEKKQKNIRFEMEKAKAESLRKNRKSIEILARGLLEEQVSHTEASIRISVLMDSLALVEEVKEKYQVFYQLAKATAHIPILEQWKRLDRKQKNAFDREREGIENTYRDFVIASSKQLLFDNNIVILTK